MALLMFDGFEVYDVSSDMVSGGNWSVSAFTIVSSPVRTGSQCIRRYSSNNPTTKDFADPTTLFVGAGLQANSDSYKSLINVMGDQGTLVATLKQDGGILSVEDGGANVLWTDTFVRYVLNQFDYYEMKVTLNGASSQVIIRMNGVEIFDSGLISLSAGSNTGLRNVIFYYQSSTNFSYGFVDDVYVCDNSGTSHNTFLGPVRVHALKPNSDDSITWSPNSGGTNYTQVDDLDTGLDNDTTYVFTSTVGNKDIYGLEPLPSASLTPIAVQTFYSAKIGDGSGGAGVASILKSGVTEVEGPEKALTSSYTLFGEEMQDQNPDTSAEWTVDDVNALQVGIIMKSNL